MRIEEFGPEKKWWNNREENEFAWKVPVEHVKANNYNLDIKNPNAPTEDHGDPGELLTQYKKISAEMETIRTRLKKELMEALGGEILIDLFIDNFEILIGAPNGMKKLRQMILQFAVMGKLVPQDPKDEPASVLLEKIKEEKERLIKEGKIKRENKLPEIKEKDIPFELPKSWEWSHLQKVCFIITDGEHFTPNYSIKGVPIISAKHIGKCEIILDDIKFVSKEVAQKCWNRCFPEKGDILVVSRGGGIGRTIISNISGYCLMGSVLLFKPVKQISNKYLLYNLNSPIGNNLLKTTSSHTAQQAIYIAHLKRDYILPLPPFQEQKRIVARVDELMGLCERLEQSLKRAEEKSEKIFNAIVHHLQTTGKSFS